jgi:hypothetical protein
MSDRPNGTPGDIPPEEEKATDITREVYTQLTSGERLVAIGAVIVLVFNLLIGDIIMGEYFLSNSTWLISLAVLFSVFFYYRGREAAWHRYYPWMIEVGGWATAAIGIVGFLGRLIGTSFPSGSGLFFAFGFYIAAALMGAGAYMIRQDRRTH